MSSLRSNVGLPRRRAGLDVAARLARLRVPAGFVAGMAALYLARPTWDSLAAGGLVAAVGEAIRVWAAGHLEKGRELTRSGPYRWMSHPLYVGSALMGVGLAVASASWLVAAVVAVYLVAAVGSAIGVEEAHLREKFGREHEAYKRGTSVDRTRRFSIARVLRNREPRALVGLLVVAMVLALRVAFGI